MRISDWSSDVCSSDLLPRQVQLDRSPSPPGSHPARPRLCRIPTLTALPAAARRWLGRERSDHRTTRSPVHPGPWAMTMQGHTPKPLNYRTRRLGVPRERSEEHTSELQSLMRISYAVFCLTK